MDTELTFSQRRAESQRRQEERSKRGNLLQTRPLLAVLIWTEVYPSLLQSVVLLEVNWAAQTYSRTKNSPFHSPLCASSHEFQAAERRRELDVQNEEAQRR